MIPFRVSGEHRRNIRRTRQASGMHLKATRMSVNPVIAIVDDDEAVRIATASLLRSFGFETRIFASAEDFLAAGMDTQAACLITDVQMPGVGGIELQKILCARKCPIPILFMTAYGNEAVRQRALAAGAVCFLEKPFDGETIVRHLRDALRSTSRSATPRSASPRSD
jgi:FixJ family two-component response regulator